MTADWMPGQPRPPYLDGSAPGYVTILLIYLFIYFCLIRKKGLY
jgi:hypothetical protein